MKTLMTGRWTSVAVAATLAIGLLGATALVRYERAASVPMSIARAELRPAALTPLPAVQAYESINATIVEVPAEGTGDVRVVMVFDDTLPADL